MTITGRRATLFLACIAATAAHLPAPASAGTFTTLYTFTGLKDGGVPLGGLTYIDGALYGTTVIGGLLGTSACNRGCGTVFKVDPKKGGETVVYAFKGAPDGSGPSAGLTREKGLLYGTTQTGGAAHCGYDHTIPCGTVFQLDPKTGAETVLYQFGGTEEDGQFPVSSLVYQSGTLFGTTEAGGTDTLGTVFGVNAHTGAETVLHSFTGGPDGMFPEAGLTFHNGKLFGTTAGNQPQGNYGTVFSVDPASGAEHVLTEFRGSNGLFPVDGLLFRHGALYGTTTDGGPLSCCGVVFKIDAATGAETVLYNFTANGGNDGWDSTAGLIEVGGMLYGTTFAGGIANCFNGYTCGTIFQVDPQTGTETVLYDFPGGKGPGQPMAGLIYVDGAFYGTTAGENINACENQLGCGTVFKFVP